MHELGIMQSAMENVTREAEARRASKVHVITLEIGALAGVDPEALRFAFDVVTRGTLAEGAELRINAVSVRAYCKKCAADFSAEVSAILVCPRCGEFSGDIRAGRELLLSRIEMS